MEAEEQAQDDQSGDVELVSLDERVGAVLGGLGWWLWSDGVDKVLDKANYRHLRPRSSRFRPETEIMDSRDDAAVQSRTWWQSSTFPFVHC